MLRRAAILAVALMVAAPAWADEATGPCQRAPQSMKFGGMDMDVVRCQVALDTQRLGELQSQLNATIAALTLAKADLVAAQAKVRDWEQYARPLYDAAKPLAAE